MVNKGTKGANGEPITFEGVYAHEQRHVENARDYTNWLAEMLEQYEGPHQTKTDCDKMATTAQDDVRPLVVGKEAKDSEHRNPEPEASTFDYPPLDGEFPEGPESIDYDFPDAIPTSWRYWRDLLLDRFAK